MNGNGPRKRTDFSHLIMRENADFEIKALRFIETFLLSHFKKKLSLIKWSFK